MMPIAEVGIGLLLLLLCFVCVRRCCDRCTAEQRHALRDHDDQPPNWQMRLRGMRLGTSRGYYSRLVTLPT